MRNKAKALSSITIMHLQNVKLMPYLQCTTVCIVLLSSCSTGCMLHLQPSSSTWRGPTSYQGPCMSRYVVVGIVCNQLFNHLPDCISHSCHYFLVYVTSGSFKQPNASYCHAHKCCRPFPTLFLPMKKQSCLTVSSCNGYTTWLLFALSTSTGLEARTLLSSRRQGSIIV